MKLSKHITLVISVVATGALLAQRFVNFAGAQAGVGEAVLGVSPYIADVGDTAAVEVSGVTIVEVAGAIAVGDKVTSTAQGLATKAGEGDEVAGTAMTEASQLGETIRVLLKG